MGRGSDSGNDEGGVGERRLANNVPIRLASQSQTEVKPKSK